MSLDENLSLFEVNRQLLAELKTMNAMQLQSLQQQDAIKTELSKLTYLVNAYTSGGTPHRSYSPDHLLTAYLALVGPALGGRISKENADPAEVLKAGNSSAAGQEAVKKALQFSHDPWNAEEGEDDQE